MSGERATGHATHDPFVMGGASGHDAPGEADVIRASQYAYCGSPLRNENTASGSRDSSGPSERTLTTIAPSVRFSTFSRWSGIGEASCCDDMMTDGRRTSVSVDWRTSVSVGTVCRACRAESSRTAGSRAPKRLRDPLRRFDTPRKPLVYSSERRSFETLRSPHA